MQKDLKSKFCYHISLFFINFINFLRVPVYMFNLYQNQQLTKDMIKLEQLNKCKLAFWLCFKRDENYIRISRESLSHTITESKIYT